MKEFYSEEDQEEFIFYKGWKRKLINWLCYLLGVEIRVQYKEFKYSEGLQEKQKTRWNDGLAQTTFPITKKRGMDIRPVLHIVSKEEKKWWKNFKKWEKRSMKES